MSKNDETVKVVVRIRPMSSDETRNGNLVAADAYPERSLISLKNPKAGEAEPAKDFFFDAVFGPNAEQKGIYDICASSVVESVLNGYNGTIFAYGQTGSGKTHTMEGRPDPPNLRGVIPNSFQHIFEYVTNQSKDAQYLVRASYLEIYNEEIRDLLSKDPKNSLDLKENIDSGVYVKDLISIVVKNVAEIDHVMQAGKKNRSVGETLMNKSSSRSHSIFTIVVECADKGGEHIRVGKLNLVDLAGSERQSKTGATGDRLKEANKINLSLTALGNVITALVDAKSTHIPYRDSKLTRLLQNSLGGNAKTVMCANCGPADYNYDETLSTLRYANRAKNIKNKPKINEDPKDAMLREFQEEIKALKAQLAATQRGVMIDENGKEVAMTNARKEIVEKIVHREVIKEVKVGASKEEIEEIKRKMEQEKEIVTKQAQSDMKALIEAHSRTAQERAELQQALDREAEDKRKVEEQQKALQQKLRSMEEKLIKGSEVMSKAQQQEAALRKAEQELRERKMQEMNLARELAEKEEANLQLEEHFSSLQEEVEVKTKKLKKLWNKYQAAVRETSDLQAEFQTERTDMLDTIRQLTQTLKLKDLIIANFIPEDYAKGIEKRAVYSEEEENWTIPKMDLTGNALRASSGNMVNRPLSNTKLRRPETDFARQRKQFDNNPRYKYDNIVSFDLDPSEKTTQEFTGPGMKSRVDMYLNMDLPGNGNGTIDDSDEITFDNTQPISSPYLSYGANNPNGPSDNTDDRSVRPSNSEANNKASKERPKTTTGKKKSSEAKAVAGMGNANSDNMSYNSSERERDRERNATMNNGNTRDKEGYYTGTGANKEGGRPKSASRTSRNNTVSTSNMLNDDAIPYASGKPNRQGNGFLDEDEIPLARGYVRK